MTQDNLSKTAKYVRQRVIGGAMSKLGGLLLVVAMVLLPTVARAASPSNDDFQNASAISLGSQTSETIVDATVESGEPNPNCVPVDHTVWFRFTAARNAKVVANFTGSDYTPAGGVYTGSTLATLQLVACMEDVPTNTEPRMAFSVTRGKTYYMQIGTVAGRAAGTFQMRFDLAGSIQGTVRNHNGRGLNGGCVSAFDENHLYAVSAGTARNGAYSLPFLSGGTYRIRFEDCGPRVDAPEWYNDAPSFDTAQVIELVPGANLRGIDATLALGGSIAGRLTVAGSGDPAVDACVRVFDDSDQLVNDAIPNAASDGSYSVGQLPTGSYRLEFNGEGCSPAYFPQWYEGQANFASATVVNVTVGLATTGIDDQLRSTSGTGSISGTVTDTSGNPVEPICVDAVVPQNEVTVTSVITAADGTYTMSGLAAGTYKVVFGTCYSGQPYQVEWYQEKSDISSADPVSVTDGTDTPGIDEVLTPAT
jgi:carboxypeptidase family protein